MQPQPRNHAPALERSSLPQSCCQQGWSPPSVPGGGGGVGQGLQLRRAEMHQGWAARGSHTGAAGGRVSERAGGVQAPNIFSTLAERKQGRKGGPATTRTKLEAPEGRNQIPFPSLCLKACGRGIINGK